ncbi:MAG: outer membrane lipoprotein-sorting protein, partial [Candidatus Caldatribacteriota bacterium]
MLNKNKYYPIILIILILLLNINQSLYAVTQLTADEIIDKVKENQVEYTNSKVQAEMILIDKNNKIEEREMILFAKEENDLISILIRFLSPKSVDRVTLLSTDNGKKIYLSMPAYPKPRRIAGSSKQENFMGTDFSYEDLSIDYQSEDYQKELLEETETQFLIEVIPTEEDLSYRKFVLYINKEQFYVEKVEFYNLDEQLTKTLEIKEIKFDEMNKIIPMNIALTNIIDNH